MPSSRGRLLEILRIRTSRSRNVRIVIFGGLNQQHAYSYPPLMGAPWTNETGDVYIAPVTVASVTIQDLQNVSIVKNFIVAGAAIFVYDTILMLPSEVRFIWRSKWRPGKVLYFATRYPVFIDLTMSIIYWICRTHISNRTCNRMVSANSWFFLLGTYIAEGILSLRTYALWEKSSRVLVFLAVVAHASVIVQIIDLQHWLSTVKFYESPAPTLLPCNATLRRTKLYINFALVVAFEFMVLAMTLWKGFEQWRQLKSPVMATLYRDSIMIFVCLFAISTTNLMLFMLANLDDFYDLLALFQRVIHSVLSARVVLHLRIAAAYEKTGKLSTIAFIEPSEVDPLEDIHHLDPLDDDDDNNNELRSTSLRNPSICSEETASDESSLA